MTYTGPLPNEDFLVAEDVALKAALEGLTLDSPRAGGQVDVGVWFRWPQREYNDALFPFITLDLIDVQWDATRAHTYTWDTMEYLSDAVPPNAATPQEYIAVYPIPFTLIYLVAAHTRSAQHDRRLLNKLLAQNRLPRRFGQLYVPKDDTVRRLDVLDIAENNEYDSLNKRVFRRMFTIGISAEMTPETEVTYTQLIQKVIFDQNQAHLDEYLSPPAFNID